MEPNQCDKEILGWQYDTHLDSICNRDDWGRADSERRLYYLALATLQNSPLRQPIEQHFNKKLEATVKLTSGGSAAQRDHWFLCLLDVKYNPAESLSQIVQQVTLSIWEEKLETATNQKLEPSAPIWLSWPGPDEAELQAAQVLIQGKIPFVPIEDGLHKLLFCLNNFLEANRHSVDRPSFKGLDTYISLVRLRTVLDNYPIVKARENEVREVRERLTSRMDEEQFPTGGKIAVSGGSAQSLKNSLKATNRQTSPLLDELLRELGGSESSPTPRTVSAENLKALVSDNSGLVERLSRINSDAKAAPSVPDTLPKPVPLPDKTDTAPPKGEPATPPRPLLKPVLLLALIAVGGLALWKARPFQKLVGQA